MKQKFRSYVAIHNDIEFKIEEDLPEVGWYLHVYDNGNCINDYLQDSLHHAKEEAEEKYGVPQNVWKKVAS